MSVLIADISVNLPLKQLFSYQVPASLSDTVLPGMRVAAPFGRRQIVGVVMGLRQGDGEGLKQLNDCLDEQPLLPETLLKLLRWAADYYCHPLGQVVKNALPGDVGSERGKTKVLTENSYRLLRREPPPRGQKQRQLIDYIAEQKSVPLTQLRERFGTIHASLKTLTEQGYLACETVERLRDPFAAEALENDQRPLLNPPQQQALQALYPAIECSSFSAFLLHGVTGSGKTEVYLHAVERCLQQRRQALILVPEISLTPQLVARFRARFAAEGVTLAVLHSGLSAGERYDAWREIARGKVQIVIGARSAIFAPLDNPGLIIVDEEHDSSYKQGEGFRYNARDLALVRGQQQGCPVLLGSATPSLASYYRSEQQLMQRLELPGRVHAGAMPAVELLDLRGETLEGALSNRLTEAIQQTLEQREQVLLLLNRRGYAPFLLCTDCGESFHCPNCSITLTYHQKKRQLRCHYCDLVMPVPEACGHCQSLNIEAQGVGTERLEEELNELFPAARIARMDRDTTARKGAHQQILSAMLERKIDILIGTQMIAKGHDFPGVALVGVLSADSALNLPDFRCAERGFALLTQVAGRAGRASGGGRVLIQSYNPEHYALECAVTQDYSAFYQIEQPFRQELGYPPCGHLVNLVFSANDATLVETASARFSRELSSFAAGVELLGPTPCPLLRLRGKTRYQLLLKANQRPPLRRLLAQLDRLRQQLPKQLSLAIDVDPLDML